MLYPIQFLWKQLNGPQITAICTAIYNYMVDTFDSLLNYYHNITIDNATAGQLDTMGLLSGFSRPIIEEISDIEWWYSFEEHEGSPHGFGDVDRPEIGGRLSEIDTETGNNEKVSTVYFRSLLKSFTTSAGVIGSLKLFDDMCESLRATEDPTPSIASFTYEFITPDTVQENRLSGDVIVNMQSADQWTYPTYILAIVRSMASTIYYPLPRVFPEIQGI